MCKLIGESFYFYNVIVKLIEADIIRKGKKFYGIILKKSVFIRLIINNFVRLNKYLKK